MNGSQWGSAGGVFTFNSAGLETLQKARGEGLRAVMEQTIAPRQFEQQILAREFAAHPGWQPQPEDALVGEYSERECAEWAAADIVLCVGVRRGRHSRAWRPGREVRRGALRSGYGGTSPKSKVQSLKSRVRSPQSTVQSPKSQRPDEVDAINHQLSTLNCPLRVLTVGAVGLRKGAPYVLEAARQLKGQAEFRWVRGVELSPRRPSVWRNASA